MKLIKPFKRLSLIFYIVITPIACTVGPDYRKPEIVMPEKFTEPLLSEQQESSTDLKHWWTHFNDPTLNQLVENTLQANHDVREAIARIREARAAAGMASSQQYPHLIQSAEAARYRASENARIPVFPGDPNPNSVKQIGFDANWEIDLFGAVRRGKEAANADVASSIEWTEATKVSIAAEAVRLYFDLLTWRERMENMQKHVAAIQDLSKLHQSLYKAGLTSQVNSLQLEEIQKTTQAEMTLIEAAIRTTLYRITVLQGQLPGSLSEELLQNTLSYTELPALPKLIPGEIPIRRPDLRALEREVAAANARVGIATADRYPRIALLGSFGWEATRGHSLFSGGNRFWGFGPSMRWPIFQGGKISAAIEVQNARLEQVTIRYEKAILVALEEIESATARYSREKQRYEEMLLAVRVAGQNVNIAIQRFNSGLGNYLNVLETQRRFYQLKDQEILSRHDSLQYLIALFKAIGSG